MAPGDYAGLQANRPRRLHSGTRSFSIAFFAEPEIPFIRAKEFSAFSIFAEKKSGEPQRARNGREYRPDLTPPVQRCGPPDSAKNDMRMVLMAPFATKRCPGLRSRF